MSSDLRGILARVGRVINTIKQHWIISLLTMITIAITLSQTPLGTYLSHLVFPEPPIYIVKARIEMQPSNYTFKGGLGYSSTFNLFDFCGKRKMQQTLIPNNFSLLFDSKNDFINMIEKNITYSISIITNQREGLISLRLHSDGINYTVLQSIGAVEKKSESSNIPWLIDKIYDIDLSALTENRQALFSIIPLNDTDISVSCLKPKNCEVIDMKYVYSLVPQNMTIIRMSTSKENRTIKLPAPNPNKALVYEYVEYFNGTRKFEKISTDDPKETRYKIPISGLKCLKKIYIMIK